MQGKQITTLHELRDAAYAKRSVTIRHHYYPRPVPAAWIINTIGGQLCHFLDCGVFIYEPRPKLPKYFTNILKPQPQPKETKLLTNK